MDGVVFPIQFPVYAGQKASIDNKEKEDLPLQRNGRPAVIPILDLPSVRHLYARLFVSCRRSLLILISFESYPPYLIG